MFVLIEVKAQFSFRLEFPFSFINRCKFLLVYVFLLGDEVFFLIFSSDFHGKLHWNPRCLRVCFNDLKTD